MKAALYLRVSTGDQTIENQRLELERVATARGWTIAAVYDDVGISGAKGRVDRPGFDTLYNDALRHEFDVVMAWSVDRISRSLRDLIDFMNDLNLYGVQLYLHQQALDTTTPSGKLMFQLTGAFAEYEREIIRERVRVGVARYRAKGGRLGRPSVANEAMVAEARAMKNAGHSASEIAAAVGASERTVWRMLKKTESYLD